MITIRTIFSLWLSISVSFGMNGHNKQDSFDQQYIIDILLPQIRQISDHPAYDTYESFVNNKGTGYALGMNLDEYWQTVWAKDAVDKGVPAPDSYRFPAGFIFPENRFDSLSVRGEFSSAVQDKIHSVAYKAFIGDEQNASNSVVKLLYAWNKKPSNTIGKKRHETDEKIWLDRKPSISYHVSFFIVHPVLGEKLGGIHQQTIRNMVRNVMKKPFERLNINNKAHLFQCLLMVHGYDNQQNEIHKTYGSYYNRPTKDDLDVSFPYGITLVHLAYQHGTHGDLRDIINNTLTLRINKMADIGLFVNPYKGKFDNFTGHVTIGKISKVKNGKVNARSPRLTSQGEYRLLTKIFKKTSEEFEAFKYDLITPFKRLALNGFIRNPDGAVVLHNNIGGDILSFNNNNNA